MTADAKEMTDCGASKKFSLALHRKLGMSMPQLKQSLTLFGLIMVAVGSSIGSGIFLTPSDIAQHLPHPSWILAVWSIGGVVALTGALTFAELGGMFPQAGGVYIYLKEAYGRLAAFLYGWCILTVITSGAIAALALAFARYIDFLVPLGDKGIQVLGVVAILTVTLINIFGVKLSEIFASLFTGMKLLGILLIVVFGIGFHVSGKEATPFDFTFEPIATTSFALALIGVLWSYGGWHHASYVAGETKNPGRTVPLAMMIGALIVTLVYLLTNLAYLYLLPVDQIGTSKAVAADAIHAIFAWGGTFVAALIAVSTFGTAGIYTMTAPRIYFAMAQDGVFFKHLARIHPVWRTPVNAIVLQSSWAVVLLLLWGTFENLIAYVVFMDWIFMTMAAAGVFLFRKKIPDHPRPYRTWGYPLIPLIFIGISLWFLLYTLIGKPAQAWAGLALALTGAGAYGLFKKFKKGNIEA